MNQRSLAVAPGFSPYWLFRKSLVKNNDNGHIHNCCSFILSWCGIFQRLRLFIPASSSKPIFQRRKQKAPGRQITTPSLRNGARMPTVVCLASESCFFLSTMTVLPSAHNTVLPWVTHGPQSPPFRLLWPTAPVGLQDGTVARVSPGLAPRPRVKLNQWNRLHDFLRRQLTSPVTGVHELKMMVKERGQSTDKVCKSLTVINNSWK